MPKKIAVIDGNSLMHRAYHAVPSTMNAPDGTPTNAVFGFLSMLFKFIDISSPDGIVCAFDAGKPAFRIEAMEQYKAQRPPMDDELRVQFPVIESLLEAMAIPVVKVQGWEGDDILGTVSARGEQLGYETLLVSGDKDVCQLVSDLTHVVTTKKGITDIVVYTPDLVEKRYGVRPEQFPDFLGFMGDSSDNIPGVPGIGQKTAAKLLQQYGSMEGVYDNLDKLKGKQLENIRDNRDMAFLSRKIATIVRDLDFELDIESVAFPDFDLEQARDAFRAVRFNAHFEKLMKLVGGDLSLDDEEVLAPFELPRLLSGKEARSFVSDACAAGSMLGASFVEYDQDSLFSLTESLAVAGADACAVFEDADAFDVFSQIVNEGRFAGFDVKSMIHVVYPADSSLSASVDDTALLSMDAFDASLAAYVLDSSRGEAAPEEILAEYAQASLPETDDEKQAALLKAYAAFRLAEPMEEALKQDGSWQVFAEIDMPLVAPLAIMERVGAPIDTDALEDLGRSTQEEIDQLKTAIYELAGEEFNIDSPKQLAHILFEVLELPHGKKTQRGYSTDAKVLGRLAEDHEIASEVLHYREFAKIKSTYIDALPRLAALNGDGRVHSTFNQMVTATGRLSSSDPNLQNIPVRTDFGRKIRHCFGALEPGHLFLSADYSQIELRLLAHLSEDEHLIAAFCSGADFHAATASRVFGVPLEEVTPAMRSRAKAVNFGIVYGQQAFGLAQTLQIPMADARQMIERYFEAYPGVRAYLDATVEEARQRGFAQTMFGRKRRIRELSSRNAVQRGFGERTAMNHPMQGSAADIIKIAMRTVAERLADEGFEAKLLLQVHDELDFSVPHDEVEPLGAMVKEAMEGAAELRVPLVADVSWAETWAEAH